MAAAQCTDIACVLLCPPLLLSLLSASAGVRWCVLRLTSRCWPSELSLPSTSSAESKVGPAKADAHSSPIDSSPQGVEDWGVAADDWQEEEATDSMGREEAGKREKSEEDGGQQLRASLEALLLHHPPRQTRQPQAVADKRALQLRKRGRNRTQRPVSGGAAAGEGGGAVEVGGDSRTAGVVLAEESTPPTSDQTKRDASAPSIHPSSSPFHFSDHLPCLRPYYLSFARHLSADGHRSAESSTDERHARELLRRYEQSEAATALLPSSSTSPTDAVDSAWSSLSDDWEANSVDDTFVRFARIIAEHGEVLRYHHQHPSSGPSTPLIANAAMKRLMHAGADHAHAIQPRPCSRCGHARYGSPP